MKLAVSEPPLLESSKCRAITSNSAASYDDKASSKYKYVLQICVVALAVAVMAEPEADAWGNCTP